MKTDDQGIRGRSRKKTIMQKAVAASSLKHLVSTAAGKTETVINGIVDNSSAVQPS